MKPRLARALKIHDVGGQTFGLDVTPFCGIHKGVVGAKLLTGFFSHGITCVSCKQPSSMTISCCVYGRFHTNIQYSRYIQLSILSKFDELTVFTGLCVRLTSPVRRFNLAIEGNVKDETRFKIGPSEVAL